MWSKDDIKKINFIAKEFKKYDGFSIRCGRFIIGIVDRNHYYMTRQELEAEADMRAYTKIANFLDELPKIEDTNKMYEIGWNDCINAILEEVDWEKKKI